MIKVKVEKLQKSFGSLEVWMGIDLEVKVPANLHFCVA